MDRGAWRAAVHGVAKNRPQLRDQAQHITSNGVVRVGSEQRRDSAIRILSPPNSPPVQAAT